MINPIVIKKWGSLLLVGFLSGIAFFVGLLFYGTFGGIGFLLASLIISLPLANIMLRNPFSSMLEGKGILVFNLDSTGIITPFIVGVNSPYVSGRLGKNAVHDVFDRESVYQIAEPVVSENKVELKNGRLILDLDASSYNEKRFAFMHYPVLLYNAQLQSFVTKDFLSKNEKDSFAEHGVLYLNRKVEELSTAMLNFGRYVIESLKPKTDFFKNPWLYVILGIVLVGLGLFFLPDLMSGFSGAGGAVSSAVNSGAGAVSNAAVPALPS